ncbi:MAG: hypothetical protein KDD50_00815, partial [Bdellovibrionales bacterium]|nr:hypothetical protein [Bdellovibrionales bacterium]
MKIKLFKVRVFFLLSVLNFPVSSWAVGVTNHAIDFVSGSGDAKILLLDGDSVNRSFLTKVNRQIEASYSFDSRGRYQANSISGFVSSKWRELEMASQGERSLLNNYRSKGELLRNYKANTIIDPKSENSILRKHSIFPLESTTYYNPEDKVVIAQDFQTALPENICQVLEWPSINLELEMKKFEDEIVKIIQ